MELKHYWQCLWKHRYWLIATFLAVVLVTGAVTFTMAPVYQAASKILLEKRDSPLPDLSRQEQDRLTSVARDGNPIDTQTELIQSAPIIRKVIQRLDLRNLKTGEPLTQTEFLAAAAVMGSGGSDILRLSYQDEDPERAKRIADTWAQVFIEESRSANRVDASQSVKFIAEQLAKNQEQLTAAEAALRDFKRENAAVDLTEEARTSVHTLTNIDAEIRQTTAAHKEAVSRATTLRQRVGLSSSQALASAALAQDPTIQRLRAQLVEAETHLTNVSLAPNHPEVKHLKSQVALLREKLAQQSRALVGQRLSGQGLQPNLDPVRQELTRDLIQAESDTLAYQTRLQTLRSLAAGFNTRLSHLPDKELQLTQLERKAQISAELNRMLQQKFEEARIQQAMNLGNVRLVEEAPLPEKPVRPRKLTYMLGGATIGLVLGIGLVALREHLDDTIKTAEAAEQALKLPTLGILPWLPREHDARLVALNDPRSPASEAYRTLRTNLRFLSENEPIRTLAFTSAGAREGKSTTAANLAIAFAQSGKRVLLVDADMRKPRLHQLFKVPHLRGLSLLLQGQKTLDEVVQTTSIPELHLITSGAPPDNPAELLESERMAAFATEAKRRYDVVLFDAPPVIAVTDASLLAGHVDGLLLVMGAHQVSERAACHALKLLNAARARVLGLVVRGLRPDHDPYYASYYHRYFDDIKPLKKPRKAG